MQSVGRTIVHKKSAHTAEVDIDPKLPLYYVSMMSVVPEAGIMGWHK